MSERPIARGAVVVTAQSRTLAIASLHGHLIERPCEFVSPVFLLPRQVEPVATWSLLAVVWARGTRALDHSFRTA